MNSIQLSGKQKPALIIAGLIIASIAGFSFFSGSPSKNDNSKKNVTKENISSLSSPFPASSSSPERNIGFFYFPQYGTDAFNIQSDVVRKSAIWNDFEPQKNNDELNFDPSANNGAKIIQDLIDSGKKINLVIRTGGFGKKDWGATEKTREKAPDGEVCGTESNKPSMPPKNIATNNYNKTYAYSRDYYNFIYKLVAHYKNGIDSVTIENEVNAHAFWCGSPKEYMRTLITAKKAVADVNREAGSNIPVSDGGLQGWPLQWLVIREYVAEAEKSTGEQKTAYENKAINFYKKLVGYSQWKSETNDDNKPPKNVTYNFVKNRLNRILATDFRVKLAASLIDNSDSSAFGAGYENGEGALFDVVDLINFHNYQPNETIPELVAYLKKKGGGTKPVICNEMGSHQKNFVVDENDYAVRYNLGARDLIKKFVRLFNAGASQAILYSLSGDSDKNDAFVIDDNYAPVPGNVKTFNAINKFLRGAVSKTAPQSVELNDDSKDVERFSFENSGKEVDVIWPKLNNFKQYNPDLFFTLPETNSAKCNIFDYQGNKISATKISYSSAPVFVECEK